MFRPKHITWIFRMNRNLISDLALQEKCISFIDSHDVATLEKTSSAAVNEFSVIPLFMKHSGE